MAKYVSEAFNQFSAKIYPTASQLGKLEVKRRATHKYLAESFNAQSDMPLMSTEIIGSASRDTMIRPVDDIDVMAVFSDEYDVYENSYESNSKAFLTRIRAALGENYTINLGTRGQVVRPFYADSVDVDIAPVFRNSAGGFLLPSDDGWIRTDPRLQNTVLNKKDNVLDNRLKYFTRIIKHWNRVHSSHLKSFHIEVMASEIFASIGNNVREALEVFFQYAPIYLDVEDPAGYGGELSNYTTPLTRDILIDRFKNAKDRIKNANMAEAAGDHREAIRLWKIELGNEFPAYE